MGAVDIGLRSLTDAQQDAGIVLIDMSGQAAGRDEGLPRVWVKVRHSRRLAYQGGHCQNRAVRRQ